ncbi:MAG: phytanoyl-CoA dioxygenase family protein [Pseudomonadales bacterium]|nr:phytanoyl-CoA dioxygenase family protein [Pseudomonadales bacterium]
MPEMTQIRQLTRPRSDQLPRARQQLLRDGYCLVDGLLPVGSIERLREWSDGWLARTEHPSHWKYQGSDVKINSIRNRSKRSPDLPQDGVVDFLIEHPSAIMSGLGLGDFKAGGVFQIISKPPDAPALYWHQDWARWDDPISMSPWPQQVFLNWYLTDTHVENGCIRVIPGSHLKRFELHDHLVQAHEAGGYNIKETNEWMFIDHPDAIDIPVKTGQLLIGDARLLHGTHPNRTMTRRTVLLGWFYRKSNVAPMDWDGDIPQEIVERDPETPFRFNREPGRYLRQ